MESSRNISSVIVFSSEQGCASLDGVIAANLYAKFVKSEENSELCFVPHDGSAESFRRVQTSVTKMNQTPASSRRLVYLDMTPSTEQEIDFVVQLNNVHVIIYDHFPNSDENYLSKVRHVSRFWSRELCTSSRIAQLLPCEEQTDELEQLLHLIQFSAFEGIDRQASNARGIKSIVCHLVLRCGSRAGQRVTSELSDVPEEGEKEPQKPAQFRMIKNLVEEEKLERESHISFNLVPYILLEWLTPKLRQPFDFLWDKQISCSDLANELLRKTEQLITQISHLLCGDGEDLFSHELSEQYVEKQQCVLHKLRQESFQASLRLPVSCAGMFTGILMVKCSCDELGPSTMPAVWTVLPEKGCHYMVFCTKISENGSVILTVRRYQDSDDCIIVAKALESAARTHSNGTSMYGKAQAPTSTVTGCAWNAWFGLSETLFRNLCTKLKVKKLGEM